MSLPIKHITVLLMMLCYSCGPSTLPNPQVAIQKELEKKITGYLLSNKDDCRLSAILDAEIYVDSIIYEMTRFSALEDSIEMITKPSGPSRPNYIDIKDKGLILPFPIDTLGMDN